MNRATGLLLGITLLAVQALQVSGEEVRRYLVAPRDRTASSKGPVSSRLAAAEHHRLRSFTAFDTFAADLTAEDAAALASAGDLLVEPVVPRHALETPGAAPRFAAAPLATGAQETPWGVAAVRAPQVWPVTRGEEVNVAVVDSGIDVLHPDLTDAYRGGYNTFDPAALPIDGYTHGTHVAGIIAASRNTFGVVGVAPGVRLWAVKALDDDGDGSSENVVSALQWVLAKAQAGGGRWVVNISLGSAVPSELEQRAFADVLAAGIVVVASTGNAGTEELTFPASYPGVIAVGAVNQSGSRAAFSNYGPGLALLAPGTAVRSTVIHGYDESLGLTHTATGTRFQTWRVTGAPYKRVTGTVHDCGFGEPQEFPAAARGEIALVRRGKLFFYEMARNAKAAGAAAVIIEALPSDQSGVHNWSFHPTPAGPEWEGFAFPLAVGVKHVTGDEILRQAGTFTIEYETDVYGVLQGTSMAAPHVSGAVALLLALAPDLTPAQVAHVLRSTATDLYESGWDRQSGWGALDALKAAQWVAPEKFGVPPPVTVKPGRRRSVR